VSVYVVVTAGFTIAEPFSGTPPKPVSVADTPLLDDHVSVENPPFWIDVGFAESVHAGGRTCGFTTSVATHVTVPPGPEAVSVIVLFTYKGPTGYEPLAGMAPHTSVVILVAFDVLHT
jgi:hypothetical protein